MSLRNLSIDSFVPGGLRRTDHLHRGTNDGTCSRCREEPPEDTVPLLFWTADGNDLWIFCDNCTGPEAWAAMATLVPEPPA